MLYFVFIYSYLLNGTEIHGNPCGTYFTKLITIRAYAFCKTSHDTRTTDLYKKYRTLLVIKLHEFRVLLLMHNFIHHRDKLPNVFF